MEQCGRADAISLEWCESLGDSFSFADTLAQCFVASTLEATHIASLNFTAYTSYGVYV